MKPPSPPGLPFLGHIPWFLANRLGFLESCQQRYGPVVKLRLGGPTWLLNDPADVAHVLGHPQIFVKSPRMVGAQVRAIWGDTLLSTPDVQHRARRIALAPLFQNDAIEEYLGLWEQQVGQVLDRWRDGHELELMEEMNLLSRRGILAMIFGYVPESLLPVQEARRGWIERRLQRAWSREADPSTPLRQACAAAAREPFGIQARMQQISLPPAARRDELVTLAIAGYETTSVWLTWTLHLVSQNPHMWDELRRGELDSDQISGQALRLYPPTWLIVRVAALSDQLPSGYLLPAGARIYLSPYLTHRAGGFFPFGLGPRRCPAAHLARSQVNLWLERLVERFRLQPLSDPPQPQGRVTLVPDRPLWCRLKAFQPRPLPRCRPQFSVVLPTYRRPEQLRQLLRGLLRQDLEPERFEVVVVEDGSPQAREVSRVVAEYSDRLHLQLVLLPSRLGPGPARQAGVDQARGEFVVFTDDDCVPRPDWLSQIALAAEKHRGCAIGGTSYNGLPDNLFSAASQSLIDSLYAHSNRRPEEGQFFTTNNLAFPRQALQQLGGMRRDWELAGGEDREFCLRWLREHTMVWWPPAAVDHRHPLNLFSFVRQHFNYGRGGFRFFRHGGRLLGHRPSFWRELLSRPLRDRPGWSGLAVLLLLALSQVSSLAGYAWEAVRGFIPTTDPIAPTSVGASSASPSVATSPTAAPRETPS